MSQLVTPNQNLKKKKAKGYFKTFFLQFLINKYNFAHFFKKCFKASRATH